MKTMLLAAISALSLTATAARAESEGAGNPFAFRTPSITAISPQAYADTGSASYVDLIGRHSELMTAGGSDGVLPVTGSEGAVQTANSLPVGFAEGTATYARNRSVRRAFAEQAAQPTQATRTALVPGGRPRG